MGSTDLELLARYVKRREADAFAELAARHRDMVYGACYRLLGNRPDAEDAAQECFLQLARRGGAVRTSVAGWLHRVAIRTSMAVQRKDRARRDAEREAGRMEPDRAAEPTWEGIRAAVDGAIDQLPDPLREAVLLRFLGGKTQTAVAEELGISQPAVSMRIAKALEQMRKRLGGVGIGLSVAALAALLETHAVEAAPATLVANLGRLALAGATPLPAAGLPASLFGPAASMGPGSKVLCLLAVALTIGAIVQQMTQVAPAADHQAITWHTTSAPPPSPAGALPQGGPSADGSTQRSNGGSDRNRKPTSASGATAPRPAAAGKPGQSTPATRESPPAPGRPTSRLDTEPTPTPKPPSAGRARPTGPPPEGGRAAQARTVGPEAPPSFPKAAQQPADAPAGPTAVEGVSAYLSPTGVVTLSDEEGVIGTLGIMAFGVGWEPRDQRRAWTGFPVNLEPGAVEFAGEIALFGIEGGRLVYAERVRETEAGIEVEYDVTFNQAMRVEGFAYCLDVPAGRFGGETAAFRTGDVEGAFLPLPKDCEGYRLGSGQGDHLDLGPYPDPLLSVDVLEQGVVPLPLAVTFDVTDLRIYDWGAFQVQIGSMQEAAQTVGPETTLTMRLQFSSPRQPGSIALRSPGLIARPGVQLCHDARLDPAFCERVADVVSVAKEACEALSPRGHKEEIRVCAVPATEWRDNIATNRRDTIYLRVRDNEFGESMRADAGPVGMLCQAVAELYSRAKFPGFDRFAAHRYLVPAVVGRLGADILPGRHATPLAADGPPMLQLLTGDLYAPVHPDFAAAKALAAVVDRLGWDGFLGLGETAPPAAGGTGSILSDLRALVTAGDPALAPAFETYDQALSVPTDQDGTHLIASFEADETIRTVTDHPLQTAGERLVVTSSPGVEVSQSREWATHGTQSLRVHAEHPQPGMYVSIADPDWRFRDFRPFSSFEMAFRLETEWPELVRVHLMDDVGGAHGRIPLYRGTPSPGEWMTVSTGPTLGAAGQRQLESECFNEGFRGDDVAMLYIDLPHPTGQPVTLYIDNVRLGPRLALPAQPIDQVRRPLEVLPPVGRTEVAVPPPAAGAGDPREVLLEDRREMPTVRAAQGASVYFGPTGAFTIADRQGDVATVWVQAQGRGWIPVDQRRALTGFPVPEAPGWQGYAGEILMPGAQNQRVLYTQRCRATDTGLDVEYEFTSSEEMPLNMLSLEFRLPTERFAGETLALRKADGQTDTVPLPQQPAGWGMRQTSGAGIDVAPGPDPLLSLSITEPEDAFIIVSDLRMYGVDAFDIEFGRPELWTGGAPMHPNEHFPLRFSLSFSQRLPLAAVEGPEVMALPGVRLCRDKRVDDHLCEQVVDVVQTAKQAYEGLFPELAKEEIRVCALPATSWHENLATNRRDTIYLRVRDNEFGEAMRADAGPVGMLCQAVAELYNPGRFPGLDRLMAHRRLVPAVIRELGPGILASPDATPLAPDGPEMLKALTGDAYAPLHPDFAAAKALAAIEDRLGFDTLRALPREVPADAQPDFDGVRAAAIVRDPAVGPAFEAHDEATNVEFGEDGTHLIASFEANETVKIVAAHPLRSAAESVVVTAGPGFEVSQTDEWAEHGTQSLRVHAEKPRADMRVCLADPDWQLKDWRRFLNFEMSLMLKADQPEQVRVLLLDDIGGAHAQIPVVPGTVLEPGMPTPIWIDIDLPWLTGQAQFESECFLTPFRATEAASLYIDFPHPTGQPVTLFIDNLRVGERPPGEIEMGPWVLPKGWEFGLPPARREEVGPHRVAP